MVKNSIKTVIAVMLVIILSASMVLAATWEFRFPTVVRDTSGVARTYYPVILGYGGQQLVNSGKINSDGFDTNMQIGSTSLSYMMGTTNVAVVIPNLASNSQSIVDLYTGYSPAQTAFPIIFGEDGYAHYDDAAALELSDNFEIETKGYLDTTAGASKDIVRKSDAFRLWVSGADEVSAGITDNTTNMRQDLKFWLNETTAGAGTTYIGIQGCAGVAQADINDAVCVIPTSGTLSRLYMDVDVTPSGGDSFTCTVMKNAVATSLSVVINAGEYAEYDTTNSVSVSAGDNVTMRIVNAGAATQTPMSGALAFESDTANETIYMSWNNMHTTGSARYHLVTGRGNTTAGSTYAFRFEGDGTAKKLYVALNADPGTSPDAYDYTLLDDAVATALTCTITADNVTGNDTVNTVDLTSGDLISIEIDPQNTPSESPDAAVSFVIEQDTNFEQQVMGYTSFSPGTSTRYANIVQDEVLNWDTDEGDVSQIVAVRQTLSDFTMTLATAPGGGESRTFTVMRNGVATDMTVTISGTDTTESDTTHTVSLVAGDDVSLRSTASAGAAATAQSWWSILSTSSEYSQLLTVSPVTSGVRTINVSANSSSLALEAYNESDVLIDSDVAGLYGETIPDNGNNWVINQNTVMPYMEYYQHSVGGSLVLWYEPNTMIGGDLYSGTADNGTTVYLIDSELTQADDYWNYALVTITGTTDNLSPLNETAMVTDFIAGSDNLTFGALAAAVDTGDTYVVNYGTLTDRQGASQDGTITWGVNADTTIVYSEMIGSGTSAASSESEQYEIPLALIPSTWFAAGENVADLPFYDAFLDVSSQMGMPVQTMYFWAIIGVAFGTAIFLIMYTRSALIGVIAMTIVLFVGSSMTIIPMWIPFAVLLVDIFIMYLYKQVSY